MHGPNSTQINLEVAAYVPPEAGPRLHQRRQQAFTFYIVDCRAGGAQLLLQLLLPLPIAVTVTASFHF